MTAITINIPSNDVSFFKKMMTKMGWTLNDKTMKVIEDARQGKGIAFTGSFEDFKKWAEEV